MKTGDTGLALALVRDMRELREPSSAEEIKSFETDVLAGFVLARASAGLADSTIRNDPGHLELIREWLGRPLWEMQPSGRGRVLRPGAAGRGAVDAHRTGGGAGGLLPVPGAAAPGGDLQPDRPGARVPAAAEVDRLEADVGLRVNEVRMLDLDDVRWDLGRFGKLNVRYGKGPRRKGPKPQLAPLINGADRSLRWFVEDVWGQFGDDHERPGAPLFPSERKTRDGSSARATDDVFRRSRAERHLPAWTGKLTPHVLRHFCASELYLAGMTLFAIQELLGHSWTGTTARYVHVHATHVEDTWVAGQQRAADRWKGLAP